MDTSAAAYVSYKDFAEFLRGHGTPSLAASFGSTSSSYNRSQSAGRTRPEKLVSDSPLAKARSSSTIRTSPTKTYRRKACCSVCAVECSPSRCTGTCCDDVVCVPTYPRACLYPYCYPYSRCYYCLKYRYPYCSPVVCSPTRCYPVSCGPILCGSKEYELVKGLYDIIQEERDLESAKQSLAKRPDFNFYDAFRILDPTNRGYITLADLRDGLASIGIYPSTSDMELYIKRYDKFNERKLRFADFCESFTP